jgi:hypothetical protein
MTELPSALLLSLALPQLVEGRGAWRVGLALAGATLMRPNFLLLYPGLLLWFRAQGGWRFAFGR